VVTTFEPVFHEAISPPTACVMTSMLRGVVAQGTGTSVKPLDRPVGGKTGTTNDHSDAWFVGFTPEYVTAVWMGTDVLRPRAVGEVGGRAAGPIFLYYMSDVLKDVPITDFVVPEGAEMTPGGAYGICYKAGTVGTGISETRAASLPEEEFLRSDMMEEEYMGLVEDDGTQGSM
jgi:penicillin-binding protein 1A